MFDRIPAELKELNQWICWRYENTTPNAKPTKVPYNPKSGFKASPTERATWCSFAEAVAAVATYDGIGFVFSKSDPYCGIDLDDAQGDAATYQRQWKIKEYLNSYAELSPSGSGLHIIVKASVPNGRKRSFVEIYSEGRYFTFTGNVYADLPIEDRQFEVNQIWEEMGGSADPKYYEGSLVQSHDDQHVFEAASRAKNGDLFLQLWNGDWSGYPSNADGSGSSEADFALIDIISFHSGNRAQIQRMFQNSELGKRAKYSQAQPYRRATLIGYMIDKSFDLMLPEIDLDGLSNKVNAALASVPPANVAIAPPPVAELGAGFSFDNLKGKWRSEWPRPNSLLGEIGRYIWEQSPRQTYETSLAAGLAFMSGLCGRSYNVSGTGLNQYIMVLAPTGVGKESMRAGILRLIEFIATNCEYKSMKDILGPAEIASGQGILKHLAEEGKTPCMLSIVGEIGIKLKQITHPRANTAELQLKRVLLDIYGASGAGQGVLGSVYADKAKNTDFIHSPAFSVLGEGVPEAFYEAFDESAITSGLLPRFTIIEYNGVPARFNKNAEFAVVPMHLAQRLSSLAAAIAMRMNTGDVIRVPYSQEADALLDQFSEYAYQKLINSPEERLKQLWNRVHLKTLKLAAILAISENEMHPVISADNVLWAASLVLDDCRALMSKFEAGEVGIAAENRTELEALEHVRKVIGRYLSSDFDKLPGKNNREDMHKDRIIPYDYISRNCSPYAVFLNSRIGASAQLKLTLNEILKRGHLADANTIQIKKQYGISSMQVYAPLNPSWFLGK